MFELAVPLVVICARLVRHLQTTELLLISATMVAVWPFLQKGGFLYPSGSRIMHVHTRMAASHLHKFDDGVVSSFYRRP